MIVIVLTWLVGRPQSSPPADTSAATTAPVTTTSPTETPEPDSGGCGGPPARSDAGGVPPGRVCPTLRSCLDPGVLAALRCGPNVDPDGPSASRYRLLADTAELQPAFDRLVKRLDVVVCPGDIASPGPWFPFSADPQRTLGIVVCGFEQGDPVVAWSNIDKSMIIDVRTGPGDDGLDQLFRWWALHS